MPRGSPTLHYYYALVGVGIPLAASSCWFAVRRLQADRWNLVRRHKYAWVRHVYQSVLVYHFAWKIDRAYNLLDEPVDALELFPGGTDIIKDILATGPETFQSKPTNLAQIESLMDCVCSLVQTVRESGTAAVTPLVLDIGAGKALLTRAIYEALGRKVAVVALDSRRASEKDRFYDPEPEPDDQYQQNGEQQQQQHQQPYTRIVANVKHMASRTAAPLQQARGGGVVAITKHLCGGATDSSLMAMCCAPLNDFVGACCLAPCCHQKTRKDQYCNIAYLESMGFCQTHVGMRGGTQDVDWKNFGMLVSMSRAKDLHDWEYKKSKLLSLLGFARARDLGKKVRRLLEEGRIRYLRNHGFDAHLVRYCDELVAGDNLAIIATKRRS